MRLRRLLPSDADAYRAMMLRVYADAPEAFVATVEERARLPAAWWAARVSDAPDADERVIGAFDRRRRLVGAAGLRLDRGERTAHRATLFGVAVDARARGCGTGRALVGAVLAEARSTPGLRILRLGFIAPNAPACRLYTSCGFVLFGTEPDAVRSGDGFRALVHMWRRIEAPP